MIYCIKKTMVDNKGKKTYVLLNNGLSEILEFRERSEAEKLVEVLNINSDSGWVYEVIPVAG